MIVIKMIFSNGFCLFFHFYTECDNSAVLAVMSRTQGAGGALPCSARRDREIAFACVLARVSPRKVRRQGAGGGLAPLPGSFVAAGAQKRVIAARPGWSR
jgi:hypothetical protein